MKFWDKTKKHNIAILSLLYVTALFCAIAAITGFHYLVSDDYWMARIFSGSMTGTPEMMPKNTSWIFSALVTSLYRLDNRFGWFTILQVFLLWLSNVVICKCILDETKNIGKLGILLGLGGFTLLFCGTELIFAVNLVYSITPAVCAAGASVLTLHSYKSKKRAFDFALTAFLLFFALTMREKTAYAALAVYFGTLFLSVVSFEFGIKDAAKRAAVTVFIMGAVLITNSLFVNHEWKEALELEYARADFIDYAHVPYEGNEELYNSIGWSEEKYKIAELYMMIDPAFSPENFKVLSEASQKLKEPLATRLITSAKKVFSYGGIYGFTALSGVFMALSAVIFAMWGKKKQIIASFCYLIGFYALYIYVVSLGRELRYVVSTAFILALLPLAYCFANTVSENWHSGNSKAIKALRLLPVGCAALMLALLSFSEIRSSVDIPKTPGRNMEAAYIDAVNDYGIENSGNVYFFLPLGSAYGNTEKFYQTELKKPTNVITTISWCTQIPTYPKQLKLNGIENLSKETFFQDNVYLVYGTNFPIRAEDYCLTPFMDYLREDYPETQLNVIYEADNFNVCKIIK